MKMSLFPGLTRAVGTLICVVATLVWLPAKAADADHLVLFENVRIFDGVSSTLSAPSNVLVAGNTIAAISTSAIALDDDAQPLVIDGDGRTLMPGLIDAHVHIMMESIGIRDGLTSDIGYVTLVASQAAERMLLRGFTSVRDVGGASFALKRAIDEGLVSGPRIYPSGATISQTSGHGDYRFITDLPRTGRGGDTYLEQTGMTAIADGADQVLLRTRENLMRGATQIKLMAGGGVSSSYDPLDVTQYTPDELHAAVQAAANWGTYVTVHAYTADAVRQAVEAGVLCVEHGQLIDEKTAKLMAKKGVWWSLQPFLDDEDANPFPAGSANRLKQLMVSAGTDRAYAMAIKHNINTAWGTDTLFNAHMSERQGRKLAKMTRWYTPAQVLNMATANNAQLLALSGPRNPYPGELGVVKEGAYADLLLVDGDPIADIRLLENPQAHLLVIMKDGQLVKHTVPPVE